MTLQDVATEAGVSLATVSRVMNGSSRVAPEIAGKVQAVLEETGYRLRARRPGRKTADREGVKTGNLLLLFTGLNLSDHAFGSVYPALVHGVETTVHEAGLKLMVAKLPDDGTTPAALDSREVDGILLFAYRRQAVPATAERWLREIPAVCLMRAYPEFHDLCDHVLFDNGVIGGMAAEHLAAKGHRLLAALNMDPDHEILAARQQDFVSRARALGLRATVQVSPAKPLSLSDEIEAFGALVDRLVAEQPGTTGFFVTSASHVVQAYHALQSRGLVPGVNADVVVCDNAPFFLSRLAPRPAVIDINDELVGSRGVDQLLWRIAHRDVANRVRITIDPVLLPGEGSAPSISAAP
jgi:LacI family transcriptional regulator